MGFDPPEVQPGRSSPPSSMLARVISVLLPARNAGSTLAAALRSVERQTLRDWECVIVDDGQAVEFGAPLVILE